MSIIVTNLPEALKSLEEKFTGKQLAALKKAGYNNLLKLACAKESTLRETPGVGISTLSSIKRALSKIDCQKAVRDLMDSSPSSYNLNCSETAKTMKQLVDELCTTREICGEPSKVTEAKEKLSEYGLLIDGKAYEPIMVELVSCRNITAEERAGIAEKDVKRLRRINQFLSLALIGAGLTMIAVGAMLHFS